jgi:hypothetical protein
LAGIFIRNTIKEQTFHGSLRGKKFQNPLSFAEDFLLLKKAIAMLCAIAFIVLLADSGL